METEDQKDVQTENQEADSSPDEAAESTEEQTQATEEEQKHVPYERFKEINDRYRKTEEELQKFRQELQELKTPKKEVDPQVQAVKDQLRQLGFMSREDFEAEQTRQREDAAVQAEIGKLESEWNGKDGKPKFERQEVVQFAIDHGINDLEAAFLKLRKAEVLNYHIAQASTKTRGVKSEASDGSGGTQGTSKDDLKNAAITGDKTALKSYLKTFLKS
jgi:chromosome segregation ATPase